jgi:hypothetical protein
LRKADKGRAKFWGEAALRNPITGIAGCCAPAASGHAAAPPISVMNSRRFMSDPKVWNRHLSDFNGHFDRGQNRHQKALPQCTANVAVGSLADKPALANIHFCPLLLQ